MSQNDKKITKAAGPGRPKNFKKRADILRTAGEMFMSKGYVGTTMDDIAAAANVSKLTVYNHFGTKEDLFTEVIHHKCDQFTGEHLFNGFEGKQPVEELNKIGCAFIDLIFSHEALSMHRIMMTDGTSSPELGILFYQAGPQRLYTRFVNYLSKLEQHHSDLLFSDKAKAATLFFDLFKGDLHMRAILNIPPQKTIQELYQVVPEAVHFFLKVHQKDK